jgi:acyl dehydratase
MTATQGTSTYTVEAYNVSHASENKIHDDSVAKKLGFTGGLVPGVEVYAYATHLAIERWGRAWLERGTMECRFLKPVYDGEQATVTGWEEHGGLAVKVESKGDLCATGLAALPASTAAAPSVETWAIASPPALADRPPATPESLAAGKVLGIQPMLVTPELHGTYLKDVRETSPLYEREKLVHPGQLLRLCNSALRENVVLPPWIHTGSKVQNFAPARVGDELTVRARVVDNYERKGHRLVDIDALLVANGAKVLARVLHTAIYQLRHLGGA